MTEVDKGYRKLYERLCQLEDWELEDDIDELKVMAYDEIAKVMDIDSFPINIQKIMLKITSLEN